MKKFKLRKSGKMNSQLLKLNFKQKSKLHALKIYRKSKSRTALVTLKIPRPSWFQERVPPIRRLDANLIRWKIFWKKRAKSCWWPNDFGRTRREIRPSVVTDRKGKIAATVNNFCPCPISLSTWLKAIRPLLLSCGKISGEIVRFRQSGKARMISYQFSDFQKMAVKFSCCKCNNAGSY